MLARLPRALLDEPRIRATIDRGARLDARDAIEQRRLGGVRQGQRLEDHHQDSVLRLRRGARSAVGRRDRARARSARRASASIATTARSKRGYDFLRSEQESDGSWFGRWGVNHIYGTAAVLPALAALGEDMSQDFVRRAADWLRRSPERGRRLGRDVRVVHGRRAARTRPEHGVADRMGAARADRDRRPRPRARDSARRRVPRRATA